MGRGPFNQNFRYFWSKTKWIGSVRVEIYWLKSSAYRSGLFDRSVRSDQKIAIPFDHFRYQYLSNGSFNANSIWIVGWNKTLGAKAGRERNGAGPIRRPVLQSLIINSGTLRWYGTLNMDHKVCLNMVKKDQLCAIALKKRN